MYLPQNLFFVDVEIMQIEVAVPEIGQGCRHLVKRYFLVVTVETDCVLFRFVRRIELIREILLQYLRIVRAVRGVASVAIAVLNRPVRIQGGLDAFPYFDMAVVAYRSQAGL